MVQFCYLRLSIDNFSRRLLRRIARIENGLKLRPTTRYMIQQPDKYKTDSDQMMKVPKKVTLKYFMVGLACMIMSGRSEYEIHDWCVWI